MKIKSIKKFFIFFSLLIILVGIVSATEIEEDSDVKNSTENVEESMFSDTTILQSNSIVEKKDKNIFKSDKPTKTSTIPTKISIDSINNTQYTDNVTISGNYKDVTGRILRYTPLSLKINSNTYQIQTDNNGNFIEKFRTNAVGTNIVTISYSGNTKFSGTTTTETFLVTKQKTNITINPIETTQYTDYVVISGKYTDKNGVNLRYTPITLNINGIKYTTTTNNYGDYTFNYKTNNVGSNVVTSSYPGNTRYSGTTFTTTFYVTNKDTKITINPIETKSIVSILRITGKYEDNSGNKLRYTTLTLNINGIKYTTKTDANGEFTLNYQTRTVGENKIIVSYPGNIRYKAATTESTFNVISKATLLKLNVYNDFVQYTDYNEIWGIFTDNDGNPLRYTTLNLNINGKKYYIKTDNDG
ncbi:MAG: hypothetical protein E7Z85_08820 [Methanosphaera stadtmanae]|nr:hypothetical protein [Methanosphaera stadtmanae]